MPIKLAEKKTVNVEEIENNINYSTELITLGSAAISTREVKLDNLDIANYFHTT